MDGDNNKESVFNKTESPAARSAGSEAAGRDESGASENMFAESPVYELDTEELCSPSGGNTERSDPEVTLDVKLSEHVKRKLSDGMERKSSKIQKFDAIPSSVNTQALDDEVTEITTSATKRKIEEVVCGSPSKSKLLRAVRCSPRKVTKRSNSCTTCCDSIRPLTPRGRCASVDLTKPVPHKSTTPKKTKMRSPSPIAGSDSFNSRPSVEFIREIRPAGETPFSTIPEETQIDPNDSQNFHLELSPDGTDIKSEKFSGHNSEPVTVKDRKETLSPGLLHVPQSVGCNYSDQSNGHSQSLLSSYHKTRMSAERTTDQDTTGSVVSLVLDSPEQPCSLASKLISKLSNGDSSTPTEPGPPVHHVTGDSEDCTPDSHKNGIGAKRFNVKNESFRISNSTTPSTISPLQNGHSFPLHTPGQPSFDIHIGHDEDGDFLSMYVVRTDNDHGLDMCKEFQRLSKRFTMDPYLADVSKTTSPSSVTSGGQMALPSAPTAAARASFASSTSGSSTRTSDGAFVVPQPPGRALSQHGAASVRGYRALLKKINELFAHACDAADDTEKVSVDVQVSPALAHSGGTNGTNGTASPEEMSHCDRATPKSSLKKTKVKGRRPLAGKTKRALLPTQAEEPELAEHVERMHGINSPEMVPSFPAVDGKDAKEAATPKSVSKVKARRGRPESPRPATPLEPEPAGHAPGTLVLAKWVDKRYYSGKVVEMLEAGKYQIEFDDGHRKALLEELIVFGDTRTLPLAGQSVYALVDAEQTYEPGLVLAVERDASDNVVYRCTTDGDATVCVTATELYLTEDQARALKESPGQAPGPAASPAPTTPRRRLHRELDLDNIIHGPRSARSSAKKRVVSPKSPKASTSGIKGRTASAMSGRKQRQVSESSEVSEGSCGGGGSGVAAALVEEVPGVEPEVQKTPRKIDGVKAGPLLLKGAARQTTGKKNSKLTKFENDADTVSLLGPIPQPGSRLFSDLHFLLTYTEQPARRRPQAVKHYSSEEDGDGGGGESSAAGTDHEGLQFSQGPYNKERLREQLEAGGGTVHSHLEDVPQHLYSTTRLIAPRPCLTAKYIQCLAADIRPVSHSWVVASCSRGRRCDENAFLLPAGWSIQRQCFVNWTGSGGRRSSNVFKDKLVVVCGDADTFVKFWERVCSLVGARTRVAGDDGAELAGALAVLTDCDCPHELQNRADQEGVPLVSTAWVVQCLIEGRVVSPASHVRYSFMYTEPE